jgi:glycosyltransferase involved in cell wall biosynthesis
VLKPKVTIGVCVRNCENTIREAIESIMEQDYPHELMEVIFVDDGSEDKTLSILKEYASKMDMEVKIFHHRWRGLGPSRNVVVKNVSGKYIVWVDGDMILPKDHVSKQVEFMEKNPKVGIGKARYEVIREEKLVATLENIPFMIHDLRNKSLSSKLPGTGGSIFRVKAIHQIGGFDERLDGVGEDQDAAFRIKDAGWRIERTSAFFFEMREQSWRELWYKYFRYGYGNYKLYRKNREVFKPIRMTPLAGFIAGILLSVDAYRLNRRKTFLVLLPFHFTFKMIAWCLGFLKGQINSKFD